MNKITALFFAMICLATSMVSSRMLGIGLWFWVIIITGPLVAVSQFIPLLQNVGAFIASLLGVVSVFAVLLGLVAATIGGSFRLDDNEALLLFLFFMIAVSGFTLSMLNKKTKPESH